MARKSMKSRVPADVWAALTDMRAGKIDESLRLGNGMQGAVYAVKGNDDWVIKRWFRSGDWLPSNTQYSHAYWSSEWDAATLARNIAKGFLQDEHLPNVIYATNRYVVMERLHGHPDYETTMRTIDARDKPASSLSRKWRRVRRALRKLELNGYYVNDICRDNLMLRKDGTLVLTDVVA